MGNANHPVLGVNPRRLQPQVIWQTDVTHYPPKNLTMLTIYTHNFLNCDDNLKSHIDKHFVQKQACSPTPVGLIQRPVRGRKMRRPSCTINLGKRVCLCFLSRRTFGATEEGEAISYHRKGFPSSDPPPLYWTLLILDSPS